jgi:hypothetical protein
MLMVSGRPETAANRNKYNKGTITATSQLVALFGNQISMSIIEFNLKFLSLSLGRRPGSHKLRDRKYVMHCISHRQNRVITSGLSILQNATMEEQNARIGAEKTNNFSR